MSVLNLIQEGVLQQLEEILALRATREEKEDGSYVTKGDLMVQDIVMQKIAGHYPDAIVISEELKNVEVDISSSDVFVVDPIDGTENFTSGLAEWGVSVSHYQNGKHFESMVFCPEMQQCVQTGDVFERHESRICGLSSSLTIEEIIQATRGFEYRILGCCVYNMMNVLKGSFCTFENPKGANSWDILAGLNLALEHGLNVIVNDKQYHGEYLPHTTKYRFKVSG
ncbi:inositol monophosphatase family protein [Rubritalea spongiae]|uniref:Inositol monophosphatase family protein n=1 Tax=Rubritalea spongiae TaxID=430797 RepID=A0ABW5E740_9BACT